MNIKALSQTAVKTGLHLFAAGFVAWAAACSDGNDPGRGGGLDSLAGLIVSPPVSRVAAASRFNLSGSSAGGVTAYVSLLPGSVPSGLTATVRDPATGGSATITVVDGGFDPIGIPAVVGDTLEVTITRSSSSNLQASQVVAAGNPPVVVRSDPAPRKVDVPLNANVVVVFSTPIDSTSLSTGSVQLSNGATPVDGTVRLADSSGFRIEFHPNGLLAIETQYDLVVTQSVHDVNGGSLATPVDVQFTTGVNQEALVFSALSVSGAYTCGVTTTGAAYCWGVNSEGELGAETPVSAECNLCSTIPVAVAGNLTFQSVSLGTNHVCALTTAGAGYCWGSTSWGQLGNDTTSAGSCVTPGYYGGCAAPVAVLGGLTFITISAGYSHSCGVTTGGAAYCWGSNTLGQLGADSATVATSCKTRYSAACYAPVPVSGGIVFSSVSAGNTLTCGVATSGAAYCWGSNDVGQLGIGTADGPEHCSPTLPCSHVPVPVAGGLTFAAVTARDSTACGLTTAGAMYCWGYNRGVFGSALPLDNSTATPVRVGGNLTWAAIAAGERYACAVTGSGAAYCWGIGDNGVFGSGTTIHYSASPVQVVGGHPFTALGVASGLSDHTCGLTPDGTAYCWGANVAGELGNGSTNSSVVPMEVLGQ